MRIAIVGAGVSGLGAAYLLARAHEVEIFERDARPGGHVNTIAHDGLQLDTGFIVFNERNYPRLVRLFSELGVRTQPSEMSFSVGCDRCSLEWSGRRPFAQPLNAASPRFLAFLAEVSRWLRTARRALEDGSYGDRTLLDFITERGYSRLFRDHFLVPLTSALWSTAPERALEFPAGYAIRFFNQHGMLGFGRFDWRTVAGGSRAYVAALCERLRGRVHLGLGVSELRRTLDGVLLRTEDGQERRFDKVVVAAHADQALRLLGDASDEERRVLGAFGYTTNDTVLHSDPSLLPRAARRPRIVELRAWELRRFERAAHDHVLPEPAAAARGGPGLLRDPQPHRRDRPRIRDRAHDVRASRLHPREPGRAA